MSRRDAGWKWLDATLPLLCIVVCRRESLERGDALFELAEAIRAIHMTIGETQSYMSIRTIRRRAVR